MSYAATWETPDNIDLEERIFHGNRLRAFYDKLTHLTPNTLAQEFAAPKDVSSRTSHQVADSRAVFNYQRIVLAEDLREQFGKHYPRLAKKLESFRYLKSRWDSYEAMPPTEDTIDYSYMVLLHLLRLFEERGKRLAEPSVFPGGEGSVQFEWKSGSTDIELEFIIEAGIPRLSYLICPSEDMKDWLEYEFFGDLPNRSMLKVFLDWL